MKNRKQAVDLWQALEALRKFARDEEQIVSDLEAKLERARERLAALEAAQDRGWPALRAISGDDPSDQQKAAACHTIRVCAAYRKLGLDFVEGAADGDGSGAGL